MTERPILFSAPMVRAILAGTKTQTRRAVKARADKDMGPRCVLQPHELAGEVNEGNYRNAYCAPGDRLWVKEQTLKVENNGWIGPVYTESDAGRQALEWGFGEADDPDHIPPHAIKRRPSLFMTRAMSRITLEVTSVRVERLQAICRGGAIAEGIEVDAQPGDPVQLWRNYSTGGTTVDPRFAYETLWNQINGPGAWDANPWVWVVEFRRTAPSGATGEKP